MSSLGTLRPVATLWKSRGGVPKHSDRFIALNPVMYIHVGGNYISPVRGLKSRVMSLVLSSY